MRRRLALAALLAAASLFRTAPAPADEDVAAVLRRQTQELLDAITHGTSAVWDRYLDPQATITTEEGAVVTKAELVSEIKPLPPGVTGNLEVIDFKATEHGAVAIAKYVADEDEDYYGHKLHCQYRSTDTWLKTADGWRLIAGQIAALRTDPPAVELTERQIEDYGGRYALTPAITYEIRRSAGGLEGQRTGREAEALRAEAPDVLFVPGKPRYRKIFRRAPDGRITGFAERREAWDIEWTRLP